MHPDQNFSPPFSADMFTSQTPGVALLALPPFTPLAQECTVGVPWSPAQLSHSGMPNPTRCTKHAHCCFCCCALLAALDNNKQTSHQV